MSSIFTPTMEELVKIWTDIAMSEDNQRMANGNKDWNAERAVGIRAVVKRLEASGGRIAPEDLNVKKKRRIKI